MKEVLDRLKYKKEIEELLKQGIAPPNELIEPHDYQAFRWVFDSANPSNHIPVYLQNPQRLIQDQEKKKVSTSGYALSCFDNEINAEQIFYKYLKSVPNFWKIVGNSICMGFLQEPDGRITRTNNNGHFDLYEFAECNLSTKFGQRKKLL